MIYIKHLNYIILLIILNLENVIYALIKRNNMIYIKHLNNIVLLIILNLENMIYTSIEKNIVSVSLKNIM